MQFLHQVIITGEAGDKHMVWKGRGKIFGRRVHRVVWEVYIGKVGAKEEVYAECGEEWCINPKHLGKRETGGYTLPEANRDKTHCVHGHEFTVVNTYVRRDGSRVCKTCLRERMRRHYRGLKSGKKADAPRGVEVEID